MSTTTPASRGRAPIAGATDARGRRSDRGTGQGAAKLPTSSGSRKPARVAIAVLLIVGGALAAAFLALRIDERQAVLVVRDGINPGQEITANDLAQTDVSSEGLGLLTTDEAAKVVGKYAVTYLYGGQLITEALVSKNSPLSDGSLAVGAVFKPGQVPPTGLNTGDIVTLIRVTDGEATELTSQARVWRLPDAKEGGSVLGGGGGANGIEMTFAVPAGDAPAVAAAASGGTLVAVLKERGTPLQGAGAS